MDLSDHTVVPGLIDCHAHLVGSIEFAGVPSTQDSEATEAFMRQCAGATPRSW